MLDEEVYPYFIHNSVIIYFRQSTGRGWRKDQLRKYTKFTKFYDICYDCQDVSWNVPLILILVKNYCTNGSVWWVWPRLAW